MCNPSSGVTLLLTVVGNARRPLRKGNIWISLVMENRLCFGVTKAVRLSSAVSRNVSEVAKWTHATSTQGLFAFQGFPEN